MGETPLTNAEKQKRHREKVRGLIARKPAMAGKAADNPGGGYTL
jgi:hypothetical protein